MSECQTDIFDSWLTTGTIDGGADVTSHATKESDAKSHSTKQSDASSHSTKKKKKKEDLDVAACPEEADDDADSGSTSDQILEMLIAYMNEYGFKVGIFAPAGESNKAFLEAYYQNNTEEA